MSDPETRREDPRALLVARLRTAGCVFAEEEADELLEVAGHDTRELERLTARRVAGEPLEQVLGRVRWAGLALSLSPGVFVPRRRTAYLAAEVVREAARRGARPTVVDLCCGCGAIAAYVVHHLPDARVHAADLDPTATACASANLGDRAVVTTGDLYAALPHDLRGRIDVLAVNAPYVPTGALPLLPREARDHEPRATLDGGVDGLDLHRRVLADARGWLRPDGVLLAEVEAGQVPAYADAAAAGAMVVEASEIVEGPDGEIVTRATPAS